LSDEPYKENKIPNHWPTAEKRSVVGDMVAISGLRLYNRGTDLMYPRSRSFPKGTIVEITLTDEEDVNPGDRINSVLYIGFFEVTIGGIIVVGELVRINGNEIGSVAGFSDVHEPNHLNLLIMGNKDTVEQFMKDVEDSSIVKTGIHLNHKIMFGNK